MREVGAKQKLRGGAPRYQSASRMAMCGMKDDDSNSAAAMKKNNNYIVRINCFGLENDFRIKALIFVRCF